MFSFPGNSFFVEWENLRAEIIRPNLECTNGYIHVIDTVLMKRRDVTLAASGATDNNNNLAWSLVMAVAVAARMLWAGH